MDIQTWKPLFSCFFKSRKNIQFLLDCYWSLCLFSSTSFNNNHECPHLWLLQFFLFAVFYYHNLKLLEKIDFFAFTVDGQHSPHCPTLHPFCCITLTWLIKHFVVYFLPTHPYPNSWCNGVGLGWSLSTLFSHHFYEWFANFTVQISVLRRQSPKCGNTEK